MHRLFDFEVFNNTLGNYLLITGIIMLGFSLKRVISKYIAGLVFRIIKRIAKGVDKKAFVDLVITPLENFLIILIVLIALYKLRYPSVLEISVYKIGLHRIFDSIAAIVLVVSFIWLLLRTIDFIILIITQNANIAQSRSDSQLLVFFKDFFKVLLVIVGILMILKFGFDFRITSLITGLSLAGAAVALAMRESIENLIASFIIFFDRPFSAGDLIKIQNITGTVEKIGLRSSRLRTTQKTYVTIPNKQMVDSIMDNLTLQTQRRAFVQLDLNAETTRETVLQFVTAIEEEIMKKNDRVENYTVFLADIVKNAYIVTVEFFTATIPADDFNGVRQAINLSIIELMERMQIKLLASKDSSK